MPSKYQIYAYWKDRLVNDYGKDFYKGNLLMREAQRTKNPYAYMCFACGAFAVRIERAHIVALCEGGTNDVSNIHLLCTSCHRNSETISDVPAYEKWFKKRGPHRSDAIDSFQDRADDFIDAICRNAEKEEFPDLHELCVKAYGSEEAFDDVAGQIMFHRIVLKSPMPKFADQLNTIFHLINEPKKKQPCPKPKEKKSNEEWPPSTPCHTSHHAHTGPQNSPKCLGLPSVPLTES